jgi:hypothetical protein
VGVGGRASRRLSRQYLQAKVKVCYYGMCRVGTGVLQ